MKITTNSMISVAVLSFFVIAGSPRPATAQTIIEMTALKCSDYLESPPVRQEQYAAWMSGYFNAARNMPMVDLKRFATNKKLVEKYCKSHKNDNLMNVIRKVAI
jgi:acid stress chaperone HdeB